MDHLTLKILNFQHSAYCRHNSTETALLYIYDYLINANGSQKVSDLCFLDLSAAFFAVDHNILIIHLSRFSIHSSLLIVVFPVTLRSPSVFS